MLPFFCLANEKHLYDRINLLAEVQVSNLGGFKLVDLQCSISVFMKRKVYVVVKAIIKSFTMAEEGASVERRRGGGIFKVSRGFREKSTADKVA